jgi:hypothetical protein
MANDDIQSRTEFFEVLAQALDKVKALKAKTPTYWVWSNIEKQLEAIRSWTADGRTPTTEERKKIDIGLITVRELEPTEDLERYNFNQSLHGLNYYFSHWPDDPNSPVLESR